MRLLLFFLLLGCFTTFGAVTYKLTVQPQDITDTPVKNYLEYFADSANMIFPEQLPSVNWKSYKQYKSETFDENTTYWFRLTITNSSATNKFWILELLDPNLKEVHFLYPDRHMELQNTGIIEDFESRGFGHKNYVYPFELAKNDTTTVYFSIKNTVKSGVSLAIRTNQEFVEYALAEYYFLGIFYGIIFIMAVYNLVLYFYTKELSYIYYAFYVLCFMLNAFRIDGLGFQFFWPNLPVFSQWLSLVSPVFLVVSFALYAWQFLALDSSNSLYRNLLIYICAAFVIITYINNYVAILPGYDSWLIGSFLVIGYGGVMAKRKGNKSASYFLVAFSFLLIGFTLFALRNLHLIPTSIFTIYALNLSFIIEVIVFSLGIGRKFKIAREEQIRNDKKFIAQLLENEKLKDALNEELKAKVLETSQDLVQKNLQMQQMLEKIKIKNKQIQFLSGAIETEKVEDTDVSPFGVKDN